MSCNLLHMASTKKVTSLFQCSNTGGCAAKLNPRDLEKIVGSLAPRLADPRLLTDFSGNEDAAVYLLTPDTALVLTVDVIAPAIDNPVQYGQIAAANALSDVYAMGGTPTLCLSILAYPEVLDLMVVEQIVKGADEKIQEAGALLVGGHTVKNDHVLFGIAVVGRINPNRIWRNSGACQGDAIIATKPVGTGVVFSALRHGSDISDGAAEAVRWSTELNKRAVDALSPFEIHAATDITGFGLLGHALEIARASGVTCTLDSCAVPHIVSALEMYEMGLSTSITAKNIAFIADDLKVSGDIPSSLLSLLHDPQTNGGLLITMASDRAHEAVQALLSVGLDRSCIIGAVGRMQEKHLILE
jgi:selenide, water dikinase